jgi:hypothetical protein
MYAAKGEPISSRHAHRLAEGIMLAQFAEDVKRSAPAEKYSQDYKDETGETAVANVVLQQYLEQYHAKKYGPGAP